MNKSMRLPLSNLDTKELEWFEVATPPGALVVGFITPSGGPKFAADEQVSVKYAHGSKGESIGIETDGRLMAHATRGEVLLPAGDLELSEGVALCQERFAECSAPDHRLDTRLDAREVSLMPAGTRTLGPYAITLETDAPSTAASAEEDCDPPGLRLAVIRQDPG